MKKVKITLAILTALAAVSCTISSPNPNYAVLEKSSFSHSSIITGKVEFPAAENFSTKATIGEIGNKAVISLLLPPDDSVSPNTTVATGLTDASGNFTININFSPVVGKIYLLEAAKRIGASGNQLISLRTYLKWNGSSWESITTPDLTINSKTTAITIIDYHDTSFSALAALGTITSGTVNNIGSVTASTINSVANKVNFTFTNNRDPVRFISYTNNDYFIRKEPLHNKNYLIANRICRSCDFQLEDLSNLDLSGVNLTNANLSRTDLRGANLSGANLSGTNVSNTNFSGATWTNGTTTCYSGSIGVCLFPDFIVNTYTLSGQRNPAVATDSDGDFVVTWESLNQDGNNYGVYAQRYNSDGSASGSEFKVNSYTTNYQKWASVAMDSDGDFIISWSSYGQDGDNSGVYAQRYNSDGTVNGSEFRVNTYTTGFQAYPSVAMDTDGDFAITWTSFGQDGSSFGIYAKRYTSNGTVAGSEFRVNTYTTTMQNVPSIAMDSDGDFVITWVSSTQDGDSYGIYAQRYTSTGTVAGSEFRVNTRTTAQQDIPSIAMDASGAFIISWRSNNQDGSGYGIYAQRHNSDGTLNGSEFQVNTYITSNQPLSSVAMDADGDFVITWTSNTQDGSIYGIYAQRYSSSGTAIGSEFQVNGHTTNHQRASVIVADSDGDFVISWESYTQDGSGYGVYLKRYGSDGVPK